MKVYRLSLRKEWNEFQQKRASIVGLTWMSSASSFEPFKHYTDTSLSLDERFLEPFTPVRFTYSRKMDEVIVYCVKHQEFCQNVYPTLEKLGLYHGRNTYNNDDIKFTRALKEALISEKAILLEKQVEQGSGMLPPSNPLFTLAQ